MPVYWSPSAPGKQRPGGISWWAIRASQLAYQMKQLASAISGGSKDLGVIAVTGKKPSTSIAAVMEPQGTVSPVLKPLASSLLGAQIEYASIAVLLDKLTSSIAGGEYDFGDVSVVLDKLLTSISSEETESGTIKIHNFTNLITAITGAEQPTGTVASQLNEPNTLVVGGGIEAATIAAALSLVTTSLAGAELDQGTISVLGFTPKTTVTGGQTESGTITGTLLKELSSIAGGQIDSGSIISLEPGPTTAISGGETESGIISAAEPQPITALSGGETESGIAANSLWVPSTALLGFEAPSGLVISTLPHPPSSAIAGQQLTSGAIAARLPYADTAISGADVGFPQFSALGGGTPSQISASGTSISYSWTDNVPANATCAIFYGAFSSNTVTGSYATPSAISCSVDGNIGTVADRPFFNVSSYTYPSYHYYAYTSWMGINFGIPTGNSLPISVTITSSASGTIYMLVKVVYYTNANSAPGAWNVGGMNGGTTTGTALSLAQASSANELAVCSFNSCINGGTTSTITPTSGSSRYSVAGSPAIVGVDQSTIAGTTTQTASVSPASTWGAVGTVLSS